MQSQKEELFENIENQFAKELDRIEESIEKIMQEQEIQKETNDKMKENLTSLKTQIEKEFYIIGEQ